MNVDKCGIVNQASKDAAVPGNDPSPFCKRLNETVVRLDQETGTTSEFKALCQETLLEDLKRIDESVYQTLTHQGKGVFSHLLYEKLKKSTDEIFHVAKHFRKAQVDLRLAEEKVINDKERLECFQLNKQNNQKALSEEQSRIKELKANSEEVARDFAKFVKERESKIARAEKVIKRSSSSDHTLAESNISQWREEIADPQAFFTKKIKEKEASAGELEELILLREKEIQAVQREIEEGPSRIQEAQSRFEEAQARYEEEKALSGGMAFADKTSAYHNFQDVLLVERTAVPIREGRFLHGNYVYPSFAGFVLTPRIATQHPEKDETMEEFWTSAVDVGVVVDLTHPNDRLPAYYPKEINEVIIKGRFLLKKIGQKAGEKIDVHQYDVTDMNSGVTRPVSRVHYKNWADYQGLEENKLDLIELFEAERALFTKGDHLHDIYSQVHCRAGIGRTGTYITACALLELHKLGVLKQNNLIDVIWHLILSGRTQRGEYYVQKPAQVRTLIEFGFHLQNHL